MTEMLAIVEIKTKNPAVKELFERHVRNTGGMRLRRTDESACAHLFIYEMGEDAEADFMYIHSKLHTSESPEIFLTSMKTDSSLLLRAMRIGVKEFLLQPLKEAEIQNALNSFVKRRKLIGHGPAGKQGKVINVMCAKGGSGATTIAVNLAVSFLRKSGISSVALLDMNEFLGDIPLYLSLSPAYDWSEITKDISRLDETFLMNILATHPSGLRILPSPATSNGYAVLTPDMIDRLLALMRRLFDVVVIDGGQSWDSATLKIFELADVILLISSLDLPLLHNTHKILGNFEHFGYPYKENVKIVINRYKKGAEITLKDAEETLGRTIFWTIPNDYKTTSSAINQGKTISRVAPDSAIHKNVLGLADELMRGDDTVEKKKRRLFGRRK